MGAAWSPGSQSSSRTLEHSGPCHRAQPYPVGWKLEESSPGAAPTWWTATGLGGETSSDTGI